MPSESYKKWVIITLLLIVLGIVIFAIIDSPYKTEKPAVKSLKRTFDSGPVIDPGEMELSGITGKDLENPEALAGLGDKYFESKSFKQAIKVYEKVLELDPDDVDTYNDMGLALYYTGKPDRAIETLKKGTEVMPSYQRIWLSLGFVFISTEKNKEAEKALNRTIELDPNSEVGLEAKRIMGLLK